MGVLVVIVLCLMALLIAAMDRIAVLERMKADGLKDLVRIYPPRGSAEWQIIHARVTDTEGDVFYTTYHDAVNQYLQKPWWKRYRKELLLNCFLEWLFVLILVVYVADMAYKVLGFDNSMAGIGLGLVVAYEVSVIVLNLMAFRYEYYEIKRRKLALRFPYQCAILAVEERRDALLRGETGKTF